MINSCILMVDRNIHGEIVVYGEIGIKQYYYYSKAEAIRLYKEECKRTIFVGSK